MQFEFRHQDVPVLDVIAPWHNVEVYLHGFRWTGLTLEVYGAPVDPHGDWERKLLEWGAP